MENYSPSHPTDDNENDNEYKWIEKDKTDLDNRKDYCEETKPIETKEKSKSVEKSKKKRSKSHERKRSRSRSRKKSRSRNRSRNRSKSRDRHSRKSRDRRSRGKSRSHDRSRGRSHDKSRDRRRRSREHNVSTSNDRNENKDKPKDSRDENIFRKFSEELNKPETPVEKESWNYDSDDNKTNKFEDDSKKSNISRERGGVDRTNEATRQFSGNTEKYVLSEEKATDKFADSDDEFGAWGSEQKSQVTSKSENTSNSWGNDNQSGSANNWDNDSNDVRSSDNFNQDRNFDNFRGRGGRNMRGMNRGGFRGNGNFQQGGGGFQSRGFQSRPPNQFGARPRGGPNQFRTNRFSQNYGGNQGSWGSSDNDNSFDNQDNLATSSPKVSKDADSDEDFGAWGKETNNKSDQPSRFGGDSDEECSTWSKEQQGDSSNSAPTQQPQQFSNTNRAFSARGGFNQQRGGYNKNPPRGGYNNPPVNNAPPIRFQNHFAGPPPPPPPPPISSTGFNPNTNVPPPWVPMQQQPPPPPAPVNTSLSFHVANPMLNPFFQQQQLGGFHQQQLLQQMAAMIPPPPPDTSAPSAITNAALTSMTQMQQQQPPPPPGTASNTAANKSSSGPSLIDTLMTNVGLSSDTLRMAQHTKDSSSSVTKTNNLNNLLKSAAANIISNIVDSTASGSQKQRTHDDNMSMSPPSPPVSHTPTPNLDEDSKPNQQGGIIDQFVPPPFPNYTNPSNTQQQQQQHSLHKPPSAIAAVRPHTVSTSNNVSSHNQSAEFNIDPNKRLRSDFDSKNEWQERIAYEVKNFLKPAYMSKRINKNDYKEIMKRAVTKISRSGVNEINGDKIEKFVLGYVEKYGKSSKKGGSHGVHL